MRKIEIPFIYSAETGEWLNICGLKYDDKENIVEVDVFNGDVVTTYKKDEFYVEEEYVPPLFQ